MSWVRRVWKGRDQNRGLSWGLCWPCSVDRHHCTDTLKKPVDFVPPTVPAAASDFLSFVHASPSPFHAVHEAKKRLTAAGYTEIKEKNHWEGTLKRNGKYFFTRNQSSIVAFAIGGRYQAGNGFSIIGAHTDSPCLKVKPVSKKEKVGLLQVGVEVYGGGLWHTWFDRDLSVAGRVMVKTGQDQFEHRLVNITRPILRIPTLAIHLDRSVNSDGFKFNNEVQLTPILASAAETALKGENKLGESADRHHALLLELLATELKVQVDQIHDFELCLYDIQPPAVGGAKQEFIHSARLDNLGMSFCSLEGLIRSTQSSRPPLSEDGNIRMVVLFDNEEVGSVSTAGADSNLLLAAVRRLVETRLADEQDPKPAFEQALLKSLLISADMAHAVHPNYSEKHEDNHRPKMNQGVVIKQNANQRYATTGVTTLILRQVAKKRNVPLQEFVVRNDSPCGSTIGPMLSAKLGLRTIDVGNPQWSMHSIRETCGVTDVQHAIDLFESFFEEFPRIEAQIIVD